jgi:cytochrome c biogenesis protein CcdA
MRAFRTVAITAAYGLTLAICVVLAGTQLGQMARRVVSWQQRREPIPAFGQADVVYFYEPTCPACQIASPRILGLRRQYRRYQIARVDTSSPTGIALQEEYYRAYQVPARDRGRIPIAFAGRRYFLGASPIVTGLPAYLHAGDLPRPSRRLAPRESGDAVLTQRFRSLGVVPVLLAGLVDSINPCAISTLIFFLSYLTLGGRKPRDLLWIGGLFTLGVFLTYFLVGLGLLRTLHSLQAVPVLARALYPIAAVVTLVLAVISFLDYRRARAGQTAQIALQLPRALKLWIHQAIRTQLGLRHLALAAFATAVVVSALEFACTSQVYLPTLMYMAQAGDQRFRATLLLLLYNLMFVLPLVAIFLAAYWGVSTRRLAQLAARHTASAKLAMSLLFVGFTAYLVTVSVRMLGSG